MSEDIRWDKTKNQRRFASEGNLMREVHASRLRLCGVVVTL